MDRLMRIVKKVTYLSLHEDTKTVVHTANDTEVDAFVADHVRSNGTQRIRKPVEIVPSTSPSAQLLKSPKSKVSFEP